MTLLTAVKILIRRLFSSSATSVDVHLVCTMKPASMTINSGKPPSARHIS